MFTRDQQHMLSTYHGLNRIDPTIMVQHFGGMHILMSFIGCVRSLMAESGLVDIMSCAFGGVDHRFTGNICTQKFRALRQLVETASDIGLGMRTLSLAMPRRSI